MNSLSVVIITRNEEHNIVDCIRSARLVTDDIIVVDSGSNDDTAGIATRAGANVVTTDWKGYGFSRNYGAAQAKYNWILSLDADERISSELVASIGQLKLSDANCIYHFRRKNYLSNREIRFGTLGFETVKRLYHRNHTAWDLTLIHEKLVSYKAEKKFIKGYIHHYGLKNREDYETKIVLYAQMSAEKYFLQGRRTSFLQKTLSPLFNSFKSYFFHFGFLDGKLGFTVAKTIAYYCWLKYFYLQQLHKSERSKEISFSTKPQVESF